MTVYNLKTKDSPVFNYLKTSVGNSDNKNIVIDVIIGESVWSTHNWGWWFEGQVPFCPSHYPESSPSAFTIGM